MSERSPSSSRWPRGLAVIGTAAEDDLERVTALGATAVRYGVRFTGADPADRFPQAWPELADLAASGQLRVPIWRTYPLAQAACAHADLEAGRNKGKIILLP